MKGVTVAVAVAVAVDLVEAEDAVAAFVAAVIAATAASQKVLK